MYKFLILLVLLIGQVDASEKKVFTKLAKKDLVQDEFIYPATVHSLVDSNLMSEVDGLVQTVLVNMGQKIKKGDTLIQIKRNDPSFQYRRFQMKAPFDGVVSQIYVMSGHQVARGAPIIRIIGKSNLEIEFYATYEDSLYMKVGQSGTFIAPNGKEVKMKIFARSPELDLKTGTIKVLARPVQAKGLVAGLIGMFKFNANQRKSFLFPEDVITHRGKEKFVKIVDEKAIVHKKIVKVGQKYRGQIEIVTGVLEGDRVITRSSAYLKEGDKVVVEDKKANKGKS